jgi:hypothetical protein
MRDQEEFERFVRAGLSRYGVEIDEVELRVIFAAEEAYGPLRDALLAADLSDVPSELGLDPSRAPDRGDFQKVAGGRWRSTLKT